jgi:hypothetical protein
MWLRILISALTALAVPALEAPARAESRADVTSGEAFPKRGDRDWTLGAGLSFNGIFGIAGPVFGPVAYPLISGTPGVTISLERRLGTALWLIARAEGQVSRNETSVTNLPSSDPQPTGTMVPLHAEGTSNALSGGLGLRYAFVTEAPVEVSGYLLGSVARLHSDAGGFGTSALNGLDAALGLALERELVEDLVLRLSTSLDRTGWSRVEGRSPAQTTRSESVYLAASISPAV